jgi:hypothetical protein
LKKLAALHSIIFCSGIVLLVSNHNATGCICQWWFVTRVSDISKAEGKGDGAMLYVFSFNATFRLLPFVLLKENGIKGSN